MENENSVFTHTCVRFCIDKCYYTTEIANCRNLDPPQHEKDFDESKCYDVQWDVGLFYKAQNCLLGKSWEDVDTKIKERQKVKTRFRFHKCYHESDSEEEATDEDDVQKSQIVVEKAAKQAIAKAKRQADFENLEKKLACMRSYAVLPDSPPEKNDLNSAPELLKLKLRLETKKKELKELEQLLETQEENENPTKRRLLSAEDELDFNTSTSYGGEMESIVPRNEEDFTDPNSEPNTESNPKPNTELQVTQVGNYSSKQKPQKMCRTVLSRKTIRVHPDQLSETSTVDERFLEHIKTLPPYKSFEHITQTGNKIKCVHLSGGYYIPLDAWELICIQKDHSKFVKYLAQAMWRDSQLANCYVAESNALVQIVGRSPRKKLQSPKKAILIKCFKDRLDELQESSVVRNQELRKVGTYLGQHIGCLRRRLYPDSVKKKNKDSNPHPSTSSSEVDM